MNKLQILITGDGSPTLLDPRLNATYHSRHGAIQESKHVFIKSGLEYLAARHTYLSILEIGFGTGLNALLTWTYSHASHLQVKYHCIEKFPLGAEQWQKLNYAGDEKQSAVFRFIHSAPWDQAVPVDSVFTLHKVKGDANQLDLPAGINLVYFDAFAPSAMPEMWSQHIFDHIFAALQPGGILVTFCAQGEFRRRLKRSGFLVESLEGPPGKREMTRAHRP